MGINPGGVPAVPDPLFVEGIIVTQIKGRISFQQTVNAAQMYCAGIFVAQFDDGIGFSGQNPATHPDVSRKNWLWIDNLYGQGVALGTQTPQTTFGLHVNWRGRVSLSVGQAIILVSASAGGHNFFHTLRIKAGRDA
jgi:hypothetical protein